MQVLYYSIVVALLTLLNQGNLIHVTIIMVIATTTMTTAIKAIMMWQQHNKQYAT
jgi:hypothetical protein